MTKITDIPAIRFKGFSDTWEQRKLGEIGSVSMCRRIFKEQTSENGEIPFYKIGTFGGEADAFISRELFEEYKAKYQYPKKGDILISASGSIGRTVVFTGKNEYFQDSNIVWLNHDKHLDNSFLKCFYSIVKWAGIEGSTIKRLYNDNILNTAITLPSVEEQQKIGAYFENLDNLITLHQRKYDKLTNVKKSMLEKMFPQNGSNVPEIRFKGFTEAWEQRKVREVTDRYDNLRIPVAASLRVAGTTPYYGANGIQDYVDGYTHDGEFILVAEDGANDLKNYPVKCVKGRIWVNNHAHVLQGKYDCADNQFLAYAISQADIESLLVGGGRAKLNAETLMGIDLLLPNKAEQIRIGKYLAQLDNLITLHQRELEKLKNLKKACLEKMFV
ncbi:MAG: restriction endonuclease subunit S [[Clostridium] innocuum]